MDSERLNKLLTQSVVSRNDGNGPIYPPTDGDIFIAARSSSNWIVRLTSWKQIARQQFDWRVIDEWNRSLRSLSDTPPLFGPIRVDLRPAGETVAVWRFIRMRSDIVLISQLHNSQKKINPHANNTAKVCLSL